ncbi:MAG: VWA domain-containing protein [Planctomycetes bacterium]|nr:VWA domain-containing protein [Planctomycetota bacterium]
MSFDHPWAFLLLLPAFAAAVASRRAVAWRAAAAALAVAAIAGPRLGQAGPAPLCRVYVLDGSASVGGAGEALALAKRDAADVGERDRIAAVVFGEGALTELAPSAREALLVLTGVRSRPGREATRLGEGIEAAAGLIPSGSRGEIVVISDGRATGPDGAVAAAAARRRGFAVRTLTCGAARIADARVDRVEAPGRVRAGERFDAVVTVSSSFPTRAKVALGGESRELLLEAGQPARVAFARPPVAGAIEWLEASVEALDFRDVVPANNRNEAAVLRDGALPILVLAPNAGRPAQLALAADPRFGVDWAARPADLALYAAVVLDGVAAAELGGDGARALERYVASGGGLLALGGPDGFGAGGYGNTPLDPALPVRSAPQEGFTLVVALDASGSMNEPAASGRAKIAEARDALRSLAAAAREGTTFAFVAFNARPRDVHPPTTDRASLFRALEKLDAGGQTQIGPALDRALAAAGAGGRRHFVLVTDGQSTPAEDEDALAARAKALRDAGATVAAIAAGAEANLPLLEKLAPGRVYRMADFTELANLLRQDLAREQGLKNSGPFAVAGRPPVAQANVVEAKEGAETIFAAGGLPLAAARPHGRGRAAAFASALEPGWIEDRAAWGTEIAALAARVAREDAGGRLSLETDGDDLVATWRPAAAAEEASLEAELTQPDLLTQRVNLLRSGPSTFTARLRSPGTGRFVLSLASTRAAASRPWPAEYAASGPRPDLLAPLSGPPAGPLPPDLPGTPLAPWLLLAAVAAIVGEFFARRR